MGLGLLFAPVIYDNPAMEHDNRAFYRRTLDAMAKIGILDVVGSGIGLSLAKLVLDTSVSELPVSQLLNDVVAGMPVTLGLCFAVGVYCNYAKPQPNAQHSHSRKIR